MVDEEGKLEKKTCSPKASSPFMKNVRVQMEVQTLTHERGH